MRADQIAEEFPVVDLDLECAGRGRLMAEQRLPGLVVTDADGKPLAILPASQVVRMLVPSYVQDDPSLAGVLSESMADHIADAIGDKTVAAILPEAPARHADGEGRRHHRRGGGGDGARACPLVAVVEKGRLDRRDHRVAPAGGRARID